MATVKIVLDTRHKTSSKKYYVKARVTDQRASRYYPCQHPKYGTAGNKIPITLQLDRSFTVAEFDRITVDKRSKKRNKTETDYKIAFDSFLVKANEIINTLDPFSFEAFGKLWSKSRSMKGTLAAVYENKAADLDASGQIAYKKIHQDAIKSFEKFKSGSKLRDITVDWLKGYEKHSDANGISTSARAMYLRTLRTILNRAVASGEFEPKLYPFRRNVAERDKYAIPEPARNPVALPNNEIQLLLDYSSPVKALQQARDFWVLSYLLGGMNLRDILKLKWGPNMKEEHIEFIRQKTKSRSSKEIMIRIPLMEESRRIISKYSSPSLDPNAYIFPVITNGMDLQQRYDAGTWFIEGMNKGLKKIAKDLGVKYSTSYGARHSMANTLKQEGVPIEVIKEIMGHADLKTTELYLNSFSGDTIKSAIGLLTSLKAVK